MNDLRACRYPRQAPQEAEGAVGKLRIGDPRDEQVFIGPMIDEAAAMRVESWIAAAVKGGARQLVGGQRQGNMLPAALLEDVPRSSDLYRKEAFGPVATLEAFNDFDDAIARVNDSDFGLRPGVTHARHALRAGIARGGCVIVGDVPVSASTHAYGGVKHSGPQGGRAPRDQDMTETRLVIRGWRLCGNCDARAIHQHAVAYVMRLPTKRRMVQSQVAAESRPPAFGGMLALCTSVHGSHQVQAIPDALKRAHAAPLPAFHNSLP